MKRKVPAEIETTPDLVSSRFVPTDVSYSDDSYTNLDDSYPISVGSYPSLWPIRKHFENEVVPRSSEVILS